MGPPAANGALGVRLRRWGRPGRQSRDGEPPARDGVWDPPCAACSCTRGVGAGAADPPGTAQCPCGRHTGLAPFHHPINPLQM